MAREFKLYYKSGLSWVKLRAVFPFSNGELLDERLDEAYVTFLSDIKTFAPTTEFKVEFTLNGMPDVDAEGKSAIYFIIANDRSTEYPAGSGLYKHEAYLIERTKLTEGLLCSSITFTNTREPLTVDGDPANVANSDVFDSSGLNVTDEIGMSADADALTNASLLNSRYSNTVPLFLPSPQTIFDRLVEETYTNLSAVTLQDEIAFINDSGSTSYVETLIAVRNSDGDGIAIKIYTANELKNGYNVGILPSASIPNGEITVEYRLAYTTEMGTPLAFDIVFSGISIISYPSLKPYTITDMVNRVLELAEPLKNGDNPRYRFDGVNYSRGIISSEYAEGSQAEEYDRIQAPDMSMTQSTLREQLKVIGSFIHAEPYIDDNDVVKFLKYGEQAAASVNNNTRYVSHTSSWDINQYCTEIRSNAQNLVSSLGYAKGVIVEPAKDFFRSLRTDMLYVRINAENGIIQTDLPIYEIDQILCGIAQGESAIDGWAVIDGITFSPQDITPYVFESTIYSANLQSIGGGYPNSKAWAIYYTIGSPNIDGLFFREANAINEATYSPWAIANILGAVNGVDPLEVYRVLSGTLADPLSRGAQNLCFQVTYKPVSTAFVSHGKPNKTSTHPFVQIFNQGDNFVETQSFGENMKGVAARLGNVEQERTFVFNSRSQIPRVGTLIDGYAVSAVSCEYMPLYIKCTVGLTKDFNRISEFIGVNSQKRMYEISERQAQKRDILVKETLLFSGYQPPPDFPNVFFPYISGFVNAIKGEASSKGVDGVLVETYNGANPPYAKRLLHKVMLPCLGRSFGNSVHFSFTMKDNYSAGEKAVWGESSGVVGRWNADTPYTDENGRAYWAKISLINRFNVLTAAEKASAAFDLPDNSGAITPSRYISNANDIYWRLRKDNREIISYNFEIEYQVDEDMDDLIISSNLAERCQYIQDNDATEIVIYATNQDISKFQKKFTPTLEDYSNAEDFYFQIDTNAQEFNASLSIIASTGVMSNYKYWVICTIPTTESREYVDEYGNLVTIDTNIGGDILLSGEVKMFRITGNGYQRDIYIYNKGA